MWDFAFVFLAIFFFVTFFVYIKKTKTNKHSHSQNKINSRRSIFIVQKCQTCVVVAKQTATNNIYMGEVCISAASQSTACLSLYQSKDNEGSPHCNYPTMSLSVTSHKYE